MAYLDFENEVARLVTVCSVFRDDGFTASVNGLSIEVLVETRENPQTHEIEEVKKQVAFYRVPRINRKDITLTDFDYFWKNLIKGDKVLLFEVPVIPDIEFDEKEEEAKKVGDNKYYYIKPCKFKRD